MTQDIDTLATLKNLSSKDFKDFGIQDIAYVKTITVENQRAYSIHAADGTPLTIMDDFNSALIVARQNDLEPVTVH